MILAVLCSFNVSSGQTCLPEGILFTAQSQIDSFPINYPCCDHIKGDVTIQGADITNLDGLNCISSLGGDLVINDNPVLTSLTGLSALKTIVRGDLVIQDNPVLWNLAGLDSLRYVAGDLTIASCDGLNSLAALGALGFAGGSLMVYENNSLTDLMGLGSVSSVNYWVLINGNNALNSLTGLDALDTIRGNLWIIANQNLADLSALRHLTTLCGQLSISDNNRLKSLKGLDNVNASSIIHLYIGDNDSLSDCEVQSICNYLASPNGRIEIFNNAPGCSSRQEVEAACEVLDVAMASGSGFRVRSYPNPFRSVVTITYELEETAEVDLAIFNNIGMEMERPVNERQPAGRHEAQWNAEGLPDGIWHFRLRVDNEVVRGKVAKSQVGW